VRIKEVVFGFNPREGGVALQQSKYRRTWSSLDAVITTSAHSPKSSSNTGPLPPMGSLNTFEAPPSQQHPRLYPLPKENGIVRAEGASPSIVR